MHVASQSATRILSHRLKNQQFRGVKYSSNEKMSNRKLKRYHVNGMRAKSVRTFPPLTSIVSGTQPPPSMHDALAQCPPPPAFLPICLFPYLNKTADHPPVNSRSHMRSAFCHSFVIEALILSFKTYPFVAFHSYDAKARKDLRTQNHSV